MGTFKKTKLVMLPTNEKASIVNFLDNNKLIFIGHQTFQSSIPFTFYNVYILSDEEIKEGDWILNNLLEDKRPIQVTKELLEDGLLKDDKKIIATTDKSLFTETKSIGYTEDRARVFYGKEYLPQPSQSFIEKFVEEYNEGNVITEVMVEYETITKRYGSCSIGEGVTMNVEQLKVSKDNTITIRKVKDSWNRDEVEEKIRKGAYVLLNGSIGDFDKWIEENL